MPAPPKPKKPITKATIKKDGEDITMTTLQLKKEVERLEKEKKQTYVLLHCPHCGRHRDKKEFYVNNNNPSGCSYICKECAMDIAEKLDENGDRHKPDRKSMIDMLRYLDKPFLNSLWIECEGLAQDTEGNACKIYLSKIAKKTYKDKTFLHSDFIKEQIVYENEVQDVGSIQDKQAMVQLNRDKEDLVRLIGYDPFLREDPNDQPFLYSQLLTMLDSSEDSSEDTMRVQAAISITRSFLQIAKIDDSLTSIMSNYASTRDAAGDVNKLQDSKLKISNGITKLAAENCLSLKNNKSVSKGDSTWTGKIKKMRDMNLRCAEVNGFDLKTCRAMEQVLDMSNRSIIRSLKLDESEYTEMIAEQREMIQELNHDKVRYKELSRILLRENLDLKDYMKSLNLNYETESVDLKELLSSYDEGE